MILSKKQNGITNFNAFKYTSFTKSHLFVEEYSATNLNNALSNPSFPITTKINKTVYESENIPMASAPKFLVINNVKANPQRRPRILKPKAMELPVNISFRLLSNLLKKNNFIF